MKKVQHTYRQMIERRVRVDHLALPHQKQDIDVLVEFREVINPTQPQVPIALAQEDLPHDEHAHDQREDAVQSVPDAELVEGIDGAVALDVASDPGPEEGEGGGGEDDVGQGGQVAQGIFLAVRGIEVFENRRHSGQTRFQRSTSARLEEGAR